MGTTPSKIIMKIKVLDGKTDRKINFFKALLRELIAYTLLIGLLITIGSIVIYRWRGF
ncbi:MAG: RDD family protein [Bdellovibrionota bacterium]